MARLSLRPRTGARHEREVDPQELEIAPTRMRDNETTYGYLVVAEMVVAAVLQLTVRGGAGAPKHPGPTWLEIAGLVAAVVQVPVVRAGNRTFTMFGVILAGLLIDLPSVPTRLTLVKLFAVIAPLVYGIVLMRRSGRSRQIWQKAGLDERAAAGSRSGAAGRPRASGTSGGGAAGAGRRASGRYTPPKPKAEDTKRKR